MQIGIMWMMLTRINAAKFTFFKSTYVVL